MAKAGSCSWPSCPVYGSAALRGSALAAGCAGAGWAAEKGAAAADIELLAGISTEGMCKRGTAALGRGGKGAGAEVGWEGLSLPCSRSSSSLLVVLAGGAGGVNAGSWAREVRSGLAGQSERAESRVQVGVAEADSGVRATCAGTHAAVPLYMVRMAAFICAAADATCSLRMSRQGWDRRPR